MADDTTIIEGTVKFRDGKKWKSRWCVMRKLSPVADCVHLQVYRDARSRRAGAGSKASLSLQQYLGAEAGFTLDKHSNTLALVCRDLVAVLAFETRERLIQWQVKVSAQLGEGRQYLVLVGGAGGNKRVPAGPARLHLLERRFALTAGVPPRLLGVWELNHLRRFGVVEGRFCFEGGSHCGKGEGLHVLITDQAKELARDFDLASQGLLSPKRRPLNFKKNDDTESPKSQKGYRPETRLSELNTIDRSLPPPVTPGYEEGAAELGGISPYWPSTEPNHFRDLGLGDTASVNETMEEAQWGVTPHVTLERCMSCISKLGALSRSSTAALTPGAKHFSPAWTMEPVREAARAEAPHDAPHDAPHEAPPAAVECGDTWSQLERARERIPECVPERPPKPTRLELDLTPRVTCRCAHTVPVEPARLGPYDNYDVPRLPSAEVEGEYYDTPKRLKDCLNNELFKITRSSTPSAVILKKPCGCLLKLGKRRKEPTIIDTEENFQPANCPCRRVTDWANNWIGLPYCKRRAGEEPAPGKENVTPSDRAALYATIDVARKTRRHPARPDERRDGPRALHFDNGPLADYENLSFALSLDHYENARDLLRRAGVTQKELDAIGANLRPLSFANGDGKNTCTKCGHAQPRRKADEERKTIGEDYLMMEPSKRQRSDPPPAGYAPMSPLAALAPLRSSPVAAKLLDEKSASNPTLGFPEGPGEVDTVRTSRSRVEYRKRSSSADSSRFLEDAKESEGGAELRDSSSSLETLRGTTTDDVCECARHKAWDADGSEASRGRGRGAAPAGNRDSSSSNDSGVSSCSRRAVAAAGTLPPRRARPALPPRRARSTDPLRVRPAPPTHKSSSAEAEVPVLSAKPLQRGVVDTHSTSSGTSDMSDYIETLSICSSHSSSETPITMRVVRHTTSTLRPRSGQEYGRLGARVACACRPPPRRHATDPP